MCFVDKMSAQQLPADLQFCIYVNYIKDTHLYFIKYKSFYFHYRELNFDMKAKVINTIIVYTVATWQSCRGRASVTVLSGKRARILTLLVRGKRWLVCIVL